MYNIIMCHKCGRLLLARGKQKTRECPHCETRIKTCSARIMATAKTAQEASRLIRALKQKPSEERN